MGWFTQRQVAEAAVLMATCVRTAKGLLSKQTGLTVDAAVLPALCLFSIILEAVMHIRLQSNINLWGYRPRQADSSGLAVGAMLLPWVLSSLISSSAHQGHDFSWPLFATRSMAIASALMLVLIGFSCSRTSGHSPLATAELDAAAALTPNGIKNANSPDQNAESRTSRELASPSTKRWHAALMLLVWALALGLILLPALRGLSHSATGGQPVAPPIASRSIAHRTSIAANTVGVTLNATAAAGSMHLMLLHLPNCFTLGEAIAVAQVVSLLAADVFLLAWSLALSWLRGCGLNDADRTCLMHEAASRRPLSGGRHTRLGACPSPAWAPYDVTARTHIGLFVELLLFGALAFALVLIPLMRSIWGGHRAQVAPANDLQSHESAANREQAHSPGEDASQPLSSRRQNTVSRHGSSEQAWLPVKAAALALLACLAGVLAFRPAAWALMYATATRSRLAVLGTWAALLATTLPLMDRLARSERVPTIIVRKGYHILAMALFLPALLTEPQLLALSLAIAAAALIVAEILRVGCCPWIGPRINNFMTAFIDSRDQGTLLISHFSLLIGMAAPLWLSLPLIDEELGQGQVPAVNAGQGMHSSPEVVGLASSSPLRVPACALAGIMILGVADSAASAVGRCFGRHKLLHTPKSFEGTGGGMVATLLGWYLLAVAGGGRAWWSAGMSVFGVNWTSVLAAVVGSCLLEAVTTQLDNIFLPLHHFSLLAVV